MDTLSASNLEFAYEHDVTERCTVLDHERHGETCGITARWAAYGKASCNQVGLVRSLWCDVRYQAWVSDVARGSVCMCGALMTVDHYRVVPL